MKIDQLSTHRKHFVFIKLFIVACILISCDAKTKSENSNQLILNTNEMNDFFIEQDKSHDYDMTLENHPIVLSNEPEYTYESEYTFLETKNSECRKEVNIVLNVYSKEQDAVLAFNILKERYFTPYRNNNTPRTVRGVQGGVKNNPFYSDSVLNPSYSTKISIPNIGDVSFCYQWSNFSPKIVYVYKNVKVTITENILCNSINRIYHNNDTFADSILIAQKQILKLKKILSAK